VTESGVASVAVAVPDEVIEAIAARAAEIVAERQRQEDDRWLRGADRIAAYLDCPRSRVYALVSARRIPVHHDGSALVARRSELDLWLSDGGGRRP
jgi:excisionase family DNA binding protein